MNFSLPPTPLESAFEINSITGFKPKSIPPEEYELVEKFYHVNGRYMKLKSELEAGNTDESLRAELSTIESERMSLYLKAKEMGIVGNATDKKNNSK